MRGPRLPEVFSARGRVRAPRPAWRPRVGLTLLALGAVASATAAAAIGALVCAGYVVSGVVSGDVGDVLGGLAGIVGNVFMVAIGRRATTAVVAFWLAEEHADEPRVD